MKRDIVEIDEEKCNGCGACAEACHEGAIQMVNGKAKLVSDAYCDGLGACLPHCPTGAISIVERDSAEFDAVAVKQHLHIGIAGEQQEAAGHQGCPGSAMRSIQRAPAAVVERPQVDSLLTSELSQWPVQLKLVNINAPYFQNCDLLVAADCTAFAYARFHDDFIRGHITLIGCPKLDDNTFYAEKLTRLFAENTIHSVTVVRMEVPCCGGIVQAVKQAMLANGLILPYREVVVSVDGKILN
jgi:Fe-S-cluster-containing hydrogenase component 2